MGRLIRRLRALLAADQGAGLVELLVALAISALLVPTLVTTVRLLYQTSVDTNDRLAVAHDLQTTSTWLRQDLTPGPAGNNLGAYGGQEVSSTGSELVITSLDLASGSPVARQVRYYRDGRQLLRATTNPTATVAVARHVESVTFSQASGAVTVALTSRAGQQSLSLSTTISPRTR
jgi:hypothetical protein